MTYFPGKVGTRGRPACKFPAARNEFLPLGLMSRSSRYVFSIPDSRAVVAQIHLAREVHGARGLALFALK